MKSKISNEKDLENLTEKELDKAAQLVLNRIKKMYGALPFTLEVMSRRPDILIPYYQMLHFIFKPKYLSKKMVELIALSAGAALGAETCINLHTMQARKAGASLDEIFETMLLASIIAMAKSQAISFKRFQELKDK